MTLRPADLPRDWAQPMIEAERDLGKANEWAETGDMRAAINCLERTELQVAQAKKAMEQARDSW